MLDRLITYLGAFVLVIAAVTTYDGDGLQFLLIALALAVAVSLTAFFLQKLTLDGMAAATVAGALVFGLGGWLPALLILLFFTSSTYLPFLLSSWMQPPESERRSGLQVWANALPFTLLIVLWNLTGEELFRMAGVASLATALSDTWASYVGTGWHEVRVRLIHNFQPVAPGTDGGVSTPGTLATLAGSLLCGIIYLTGTGEASLTALLVIFLAGFSGSLLDSYLGAIFQQHPSAMTSSGEASKNRTSGVDEKPGFTAALQRNFKHFEHWNNSTVNFVATGWAALFALIAGYITM